MEHERKTVAVFLHFCIKKSAMTKRYFLLVIATAFTLAVNGQKVFVVDYASQADVKVFTVKYESQADLTVYLVDYASQVDQDGKWYFVEYASQADKKIYFVEYESQADLKIYYVEYASQAEWKNPNKKHLMASQN